MNYYIDTEFHEYHKNSKIPTIDLISIGIVSDDNREFYALCSDCNLNDIWKNKWLRENVLEQIYVDYKKSWSEDLNFYVKPFSKSTMKKIFKEVGFSKKELASQIITFIYPDEYFKNSGYVIDLNFDNLSRTDHLLRIQETNDAAQFFSGIKSNINFDYPKFYGYYSDYDWVVFCQLFGRMMDLPTGFPMYCRDLQFMKEQLQEQISDIPIKDWTGYPEQINEHNALYDALWNRELFKFLKQSEENWKETSKLIR